MNFVFIANAAVGTGLSGSDRIFIELAKRWSQKNNQITICVWEDGYAMCEREGLNDNTENLKFHKWFIGNFKSLPFIISYIFRIVSGTYYSLTANYPTLSTTQSYIYLCSDFWQDAIPAFLLKIRYPQAKLIGSFYLTAPNPFKGFYEGERQQTPTLKSILYYLQQLPIKILLHVMADIVFVTSEPDAKKFKNTVVVKGGVNVEAAKNYSPTFSTEGKQYDAVFLGRFHPQKGVVEMVDIWKTVVSHRPEAKLVMMGDGPLMNEVKKKIQDLNLLSNIQLTGYIFDGEEKYKIFRDSKVVVHPAVYDSGGMAAAEAMTWGIPGVAFDLEALKTYYPKGMVKVTFGDYNQFANEIINLINDKNRYTEFAQQARKLILSEWDWEIRSDKVLQEVIQKTDMK